MAEPSTLTGPAVADRPNYSITRSVDTKGPTKTGWMPRRPGLPDYLLPSYQRLTEFDALSANWDSYGALPISSRAIDAARRLHLRIRNVSPYTLAPLASGGIQIEWRGRRTVLEIDISPAGRLGSLMVEGHETGRRYDERDGVSAAEAVRLVSQAFEA